MSSIPRGGFVSKVVPEGRNCVLKRLSYKIRHEKDVNVFTGSGSME
jgi:hypothetical protein